MLGRFITRTLEKKVFQIKGIRRLAKVMKNSDAEKIVGKR